MSPFAPDDIRRYYDRHTPGFMTFGQGGGAGVIHRAVWGPGITTRLEAFHYVDDLIVELTRPLLAARLDPLHVVDLGCGVGASLCYLAERLPIRGTGVTLSPVQCRIAAHRIRLSGMTDRVHCIEGDYTALPETVSMADVAYAIESFVHGPSPEHFFRESHRLIRPGGLLVVCDDAARPTESRAAERTVDRFRQGWHINTLLSHAELLGVAHAAGFQCERVIDLSSWLELRRLRDRAISVWAVAIDTVTRSVRPLTGDAVTRRINQRYGHLLGGSALQTCLAHGWIGYDFTVFRRVSPHGAA